jgi:hypothetical protein
MSVGILVDAEVNPMRIYGTNEVYAKKIDLSAYSLSRYLSYHPSARRNRGVYQLKTNEALVSVPEMTNSPAARTKARLQLE